MVVGIAKFFTASLVSDVNQDAFSSKERPKYSIDLLFNNLLLN